MEKKVVHIEYHENPKLWLDVAIYDPESDSYEVKFIHPSHHAEVESISDLLKDVEFEDPSLLRDWQAFMNALRMLADQWLLSLDVIILTRSGEVIESED
ncbi:MAG: hypothetical protein ACW99U_15440 [Candidatus Thorarchaeota archaeon]